jgi:sugar/nucleoside kinase (ribokinase family)
VQKFITFGETMVQYNAEYTGSFDPKKRYFLDVAGAESNVAINLSKITKDHAEIFWISRLGEDDAGRIIQKKIFRNISILMPPLILVKKREFPI